jgi:hypothetical protein
MSPFLKATMPRLDRNLINHEKFDKIQEQLSTRIGLQADTEIVDSTKEAPRRNPTRMYAAVAFTGSSHIASPSTESADRGFTLGAVSDVLWPKVSTM